MIVEAALFATPVPPLAGESVPATSAVARSTAFVVEPDPMKIEDVSVFEICESVRPVMSVMFPVVINVPLTSGAVYVRVVEAVNPESSKATCFVGVVLS